MFERIVAAIDDDAFRRKRVIEATRELAAARQSTVTVAHILELERRAATGRPTTITAAPPRLEDEALAKALVEEALAALREAGVNAKGVVRSGGGSPTAKELLSIAGEADADLIIVGDRGAHLSDLLLGGVAYRIVHAARCPVLLVR
ncbi:MAG TPA: universal stress protein [Candidatus Dormibacteraeota bacterium]|jgi:nucleotide-binding universal stress UspA family protein|nr:universal stress protein [Candidatus Dormibacteraeota bacterium]